MDTSRIELCNESECRGLEAFPVERIYEFNAETTGCFDGRLVGGSLRSESGEIIAAFNEAVFHHLGSSAIDRIMGERIQAHRPVRQQAWISRAARDIHKKGQHESNWQ